MEHIGDLLIQCILHSFAFLDNGGRGSLSLFRFYKGLSAVVSEKIHLSQL